MISSTTIEQGVLHRSLEATAHNLFQYDPSPEIDSALERVKSLAAALPPGVRRGMLLAELDATIASNLSERRQELAINGFADSLVTDLRRCEHDGAASVNLALTSKSIARRLRGPLSALLEKPAGDVPSEWATVNRTIREVPAVQLLGPGVRSQLGPRKYELLVSLVEATDKTGAAQVGPASAAARGCSHGRE